MHLHRENKTKIQTIFNIFAIIWRCSISIIRNIKQERIFPFFFLHVGLYKLLLSGQIFCFPFLCFVIFKKPYQNENSYYIQLTLKKTRSNFIADTFEKIKSIIFLGHCIHQLPQKINVGMWKNSHIKHREIWHISASLLLWPDLNP